MERSNVSENTKKNKKNKENKENKENNSISDKKLFVNKIGKIEVEDKEKIEKLFLNVENNNKPSQKDIKSANENKQSKLNAEDVIKIMTKYNNNLKNNNKKIDIEQLKESLKIIKEEEVIDKTETRKNVVFESVKQPMGDMDDMGDMDELDNNSLSIGVPSSSSLSLTSSSSSLNNKVNAYMNNKS